MPKPLVVGNGSLLVNLDMNESIRDMYFPHIGNENHVNGRHCRIGVKVDGKNLGLVSLIGDDWSHKLGYQNDRLVTDTYYRNDRLEIELRLNECVHPHENIFIRKIAITNTDTIDVDMKLLFSHDIALYENPNGDTAIYDPALRSIIHYKDSRYFLISGSPYFDQYEVGQKGTDESGAIRSGELNMNSIQVGAVNSLISFSQQLAAGETKIIHYWIAVGKTFFEVKRLNELVLDATPEKIMSEAGQHSYSWVNKEKYDFYDLPTKVGDLFKHSLLIMRSQIDNGGAIIAANDSDILERFNMDSYSYMWPRDSAYIAMALDITRYSGTVQKFFEYCQGLIHENGYFLQKYNPTGTLASGWMPWLTPEGKIQLPIQEDSTALIIVALWNHYKMTRSIENIDPAYHSLIIPAAEFMIKYRDPSTGLPKPSYNLWEEKRAVHSYTCSTVYAGLICAAKFATMYGDTDLAESYNKAALEIKEGIENHLYDKELGRFLRSINPRDETVDASLYAVSQFGVLPHDDTRMVSTMKSIESILSVKTKVGGIARFYKDKYQEVSQYDPEIVPGNPWFICTLWVAEWHIQMAKSIGDLQKAREMILWATDRATETGMLAEQLNPFDGSPLSVSPLTWAHATFVLTVMAFVEKARSLE
ncbi:glycoside hydrolase family 15 protein [Methanococcoides alaskense]|uniref:GH15 family glucan-1,4-alpha-glucosidase n=1 Tax=Methanococcoides alaskense TaxID=325778 RepID=A0AA90ZDS6_9EURY|nr:glycoside hydrolase family 15 protein [Methanococcoides alaskense]MDA0524315.1 glycoside hydrolase family 15 protein [Methanococcoides alaskense]MDR6223732.1 GH15 family glucan-1,4-alpha-glucosidase [Methanococcoides alaskense]